MVFLTTDNTIIALSQSPHPLYPRVLRILFGMLRQAAKFHPEGTDISSFSLIKIATIWATKLFCVAKIKMAPGFTVSYVVGDSWWVYTWDLCRNESTPKGKWNHISCIPCDLSLLPALRNNPHFIHVSQFHHLGDACLTIHHQPHVFHTTYPQVHARIPTSFDWLLPAAQ